MAQEIEHKYLVINDEYRNMAYSALRIRQGYLCRIPDRTVRVRICDESGTLTIKGRNRGDVRCEYEYPIPYKDALELLELCEKGIIDKIRYLIRYNGLVWEVDEYYGIHKGLVIAEVEIPESGYAYELPSFVGENVTGDARYYNSNL